MILSTHPRRLWAPMSAIALVLSGCGAPLDFDLRGKAGAFSTASAATAATTATRPQPDDRGVISYPNYQVAVAKRGDTLQDVAGRLGLDPDSLSQFNGVAPDVPLRRGEVIALPQRVAEPSPATGAATTGPIRPAQVDVTSLANSALDTAPETPPQAPTPPASPPAPTAAPQSGTEPIRHKVARGETAYTIARLYAVSVRSLAEWNGLAPDFAIREGQFLLIPVAQQQAPRRSTTPPQRQTAVATPEPATPPATPQVTPPGAGTPTPQPPSASTALPEDTTPATAEAPAPPAPEVGPQTTPAANSAMAMPVKGPIIRPYAKGRNEGIDIKATAGTSVGAAADGTVAAITKSAEGVPIIVVRHPDNLLTVYANVTKVRVAKGDSVTRGQALAQLRTGNDAFLHFEVRDGFDSVDPTPYLP